MRDLEANLVAGGLRHRSLVGRRQAFVGVGGGAIEQKLRALELDRHVGELPLQALELGQWTTELLAYAGVFACPLVAIAAECERPRGVAEPLDVEAGHLLLEAARAEQHVLRRDAAIVEVQLAPLLAAHELL